MRKLLLPLRTNPAFAALAQETTPLTDRTFQLGEVRVSGINSRDSIASRLSYHTIEKFNRNDLSNALNILPGVSIANVAPRNESVVYVRGFDLRQVPVYIDGVPVYVPYDGYVDMGRFTVFDLAEVNVSKGFATIKDRYSCRMGQAIPNPDLHAEAASNYDLSYSGKVAEKLALQASISQNNIDDIIQQVDNVQPGR